MEIVVFQKMTHCDFVHMSQRRSGTFYPEFRTKYIDVSAYNIFEIKYLSLQKDFLEHSAFEVNIFFD